MPFEIKPNCNSKACILKPFKNKYFNIPFKQTLYTKTCDQHNGLQEPVQCNISFRNKNNMNHK